MQSFFKSSRVPIMDTRKRRPRIYAFNLSLISGALSGFAAAISHRATMMCDSNSKRMSSASAAMPASVGFSFSVKSRSPSRVKSGSAAFPSASRPKAEIAETARRLLYFLPLLGMNPSLLNAASRSASTASSHDDG